VNFDKYRITEKYPDRIKYKSEIIKKINNSPMTQVDRDKEIALVATKVGEWFKHAILPYNEQIAKIDSQFWADCRAAIGYDKDYTESQCLVIQGEAYERGHSGGYAEIYNCLENIVLFCDKLGVTE
jgi:hypothetical protein